MEPLTWSAPEFHYYEKSSKWFFWSIIIAAVFAIIGFIFASLLFVIFIIVAEIMVLFWANQEPRTLTHWLTDQGVHTEGGATYAYSELAGYAIVPEQHFPELVLKTRQTLGGYARVFVPADIAPQVQDSIAGHLKPFEYQQSLSEHFARLLRF